jgi:hypothetical protein
MARQSEECDGSDLLNHLMDARLHVVGVPPELLHGDGLGAPTAEGDPCRHSTLRPYMASALPDSGLSSRKNRVVGAWAAGTHRRQPS